MKRPLTTIALAVMAAVLVPVSAADQADDEKKFTITGEVRARYEYLDNLADFTDEVESGDADDDTYGISFYRVNIGAQGDFGHGVTALIDLQNTGFWGEAPPYQGLQDPNFQSLNFLGYELRGIPGFGVENSLTTLYQAYVNVDNIFGSNLDVRFGRQEHVLGNELQLGDLDFYNGQSFDGIRVDWSREKWNLGGFYYTPYQANNACTDFCGSENSRLAGVTFNWQLGEGHVIEPYAINWYNGAEFGSVFFGDKLSIMVYGARWTREPSEDQLLDWSLEAAIQDGDIGFGAVSESHTASIVEGWVGVNFGGERRHRAHIGLLSASGDDDQSANGTVDGDHEDYLFLFTDFYENNRLGDSDLETAIFANYADANFSAFNLAGITDLNVGYNWHAGNHHFMAAYHQFLTSEDVCDSPGVNCDDDAGSEVDVRYDYQYSNHLAFNFGVANFMPGDLFGTDADDAMRVYGQGRLKF
jgi:hypothetical protein